MVTEVKRLTSRLPEWAEITISITRMQNHHKVASIVDPYRLLCKFAIKQINIIIPVNSEW